MEQASSKSRWWLDTAGRLEGLKAGVRGAWAQTGAERGQGLTHLSHDGGTGGLRSERCLGLIQHEKDSSNCCVGKGLLVSRRGGQGKGQQMLEGGMRSTCSVEHRVQPPVG